ncbi:hypothetical protein GCM10008956_40100 [Deinococcus arenae]|uniref:Uncharacterized protein n=1 Tax=Deinococcus arenae TaxID=1452751 RepID=A0A8H9L803_9DEIO|nr:hypothetical protein GCM10008956_40100 [Deinococcus arenae]
MQTHLFARADSVEGFREGVPEFAVDHQLPGFSSARDLPAEAFDDVIFEDGGLPVRGGAVDAIALNDEGDQWFERISEYGGSAHSPE